MGYASIVQVSEKQLHTTAEISAFYGERAERARQSQEQSDFEGHAVICVNEEEIKEAVKNNWIKPRPQWHIFINWKKGVEDLWLTKDHGYQNIMHTGDAAVKLRRLYFIDSII
jgi:hypothetical protein